MQDRFLRDAHEVERQFGFAVRTVIATAAGALTLSVGAFVREPPPLIAAELVGVLRFAWWALFAAIGVGAVALTLRYAAQQRSHVEWERRAKEQSHGRKMAGKLRGLSDAILAVSLLTVLAGLVALAKVAVSLLPET